ncbi:MAG TPA: MFS transporter [Tepidisphaeraceae bacterium]|nr:MFS transporter [Tepidisphaeraceae bacterium]
MSQPLSDAAPAQADYSRAATRFARVMPLAFITYGLAYFDRVNYASAEKDLSSALHLSAEIAPMLSASFFLGYSLFQIPGAMYAARRSVKWLVFWALIFWGALSGLTGVIRNVPLLFADRILLGVVEGVVLPAMLIYLNRWFTKRERSRSNALLMLTNPITMATVSIACGLVIQWFDAHPLGGYRGWQMMFIVEGMPSIIWAFLWLRLSRERPGDAEWLTSAEATTVQRMLDGEQAQISQVKNYWAAFTNLSVIKLSLMFFCFSSASYGLMMWLPGILSQATHLSPAMTGLLSSIPYAVAVLSMIATSWLSDRSLRRKEYVVGSMLVGGAAFCVAFVAGPGHIVIFFLALTVVGSCIYTPTAPLWAWMAEMLPRNVSGESMALVNSFGALGGMLGTYMVGHLKNQYHSPGAAFIFQACCFAAAGVLGFSARTRVSRSPAAEAAVPGAALVTPEP